MLLPNQRLQLKDLPLVRRNQKSFNVFFVDDNDIWYQRILFWDKVAYGAVPNSDIREFDAFTEVYTLDLNPTFNLIYKHQITTKMGNYSGGPDQPLTSKDAFKYHLPPVHVGDWVDLHWNGRYLDKSMTISRTNKFDSPFRGW